MLLEITELAAGYGGVSVLDGISIRVDSAETVGVIGANGAGKTTLLKSIMGFATVQGGGHAMDGADLHTRPVHDRARLGIAYVPEGARVFGELTVAENLEVGGYTTKSRAVLQERLDVVLDLFPVLRQRLSYKGNTLSGGQRQMLAVGRGLMAGASLLLLDEPSLGLAPLIVDELFAKLASIRELGTTILFVEQNAAKAFELADRVYVMSAGRIHLEGTPAQLMEDPSVAALYLGGESVD